MKILGNQEVAGVVRVGRRVIEGFKTQSLTEDLQLTKTSEKFWKVATTLPSVNLKLPDATTISRGFEFLIISTTEGITVTDASETPIQVLDPGTIYYFYLITDGTLGGEWVVNVDTSYDISVDVPDTPTKGVRSYFKILREYDGNVH